MSFSKYVSFTIVSDVKVVAVEILGTVKCLSAHMQILQCVQFRVSIDIIAIN